MYYNALKEGNPDAMVALNPGVDPVVRRGNRFCDFTAGEDNVFEQLPTGRYLDGAQWQILSFIGECWGGAGCKYPSGYVADYIRRVSEKGGVVTVDMHIREDGSLDPIQVEELHLASKK